MYAINQAFDQYDTNQALRCHTHIKPSMVFDANAYLQSLTQRITVYLQFSDGLSRETRLVSRETRLASQETRRVSRETRRISRVGSNLLLSGTVA